MRILHLIQRYPPAIGGSENWAAALAARQARAGHAVEVMTFDLLGEDEFWHPRLRNNRVPLPPDETIDGVRVRRYAPVDLNPLQLSRSASTALSSPKFDSVFAGVGSSLLSPPQSLGFYRDLPAGVRGADLVHLHAVPYPHVRAGYTAARALRKPVVITPHFHEGEPTHERRWVKRILSHCDAVFTVTGWEKRTLTQRGVPEKNIHITGNALTKEAMGCAQARPIAKALRARWGIPENSRLVSYLGRKVAAKGIETLLGAAPHLIAEHPDARIILAGPGSNWFDKQLAGLPPTMRSVVVDAGVLEEEEKEALLCESEVVVVPGTNEAFAIVILEAWAAGTPVLASHTGALAEVVGDGGLLFEPGHTASLASQAATLLSDEALAKRLARIGAEKAQGRYSWDQIAEVVERVCTRLVPAAA